MLTRPGADAVRGYRAHVDAAMHGLLDRRIDAALAGLVVLGLNHEQQHQELLVTDMLHAFAQNPLLPAMIPDWDEPPGAPGPTRMLRQEGGIVEIGDTGEGFAFDNEQPRHQAFLRPYSIADRLVRNADWLAFMQDGGYRTPTLWMADGFAAAQAQEWMAPLYWRHRDSAWWQMGPGGLAPLDPAAPVRHVSWYEADAFARWAGARLPSEAEWEHAASDARMREMTTHVWQWSASAYTAYPGFAAAPGAIGEYNGKFMVNQMTLRGGSLASPRAICARATAISSIRTKGGSSPGCGSRAGIEDRPCPKDRSRYRIRPEHPVLSGRTLHRRRSTG